MKIGQYLAKLWTRV